MHPPAHREPHPPPARLRLDPLPYRAPRHPSCLRRPCPASSPLGRTRPDGPCSHAEGVHMAPALQTPGGRMPDFHIQAVRMAEGGTLPGGPCSLAAADTPLHNPHHDAHAHTTHPHRPIASPSPLTSQVAPSPSIESSHPAADMSDTEAAARPAHTAPARGPAWGSSRYCGPAPAAAARARTSRPPPPAPACSTPHRRAPGSQSRGSSWRCLAQGRFPGCSPAAHRPRAAAAGGWTRRGRARWAFPTATALWRGLHRTWGHCR